MMNQMRSFELESFDPILEEEVLELSPEPEITEQDVENARRAGIQLGVDQGFTAGEKQAREELEKFFKQAAADNDKAVEKLFQQLADQFEIIFTQYQADLEQLTLAMLSITQAMWRRMMPRYVEQYGDEEIVSIVRECVENLREERVVRIEFAESNKEKMTELMAPLIKIYEGKTQLEFVGSADLSEGDVRMGWSKGSAERSLAKSMLSVEAIVDEAIKSFEEQKKRDAHHDAESESAAE